MTNTCYQLLSYIVTITMITVTVKVSSMKSNVNFITSSPEEDIS